MSVIPLGVALGWGLLLAVPTVGLAWLAIRGWQRIGRQHLATLLAGGISNAAFVGGALTVMSIAAGSVWGIYWGVTAALLAALAALVTPAVTVGVGLIRLALAERHELFAAWDEAEELTTLYDAPVLTTSHPPRPPVEQPIDAPTHSRSAPESHPAHATRASKDTRRLRVDTLTIPTAAFHAAWSAEELQRAWPEDVAKPPVEAEVESAPRDRIWDFRGEAEI